jgi:hypothetical protein
MVNLLIAQLVPFDQLKYAEECLDLLDILQQDNNGEVSDNVKNVIAIAEELIEELEVKQQQTAAAPKAGEAVLDPSTSLLSDPPSSPPTTVQQGTAIKAKGDKGREMKDVVGKGIMEGVGSAKSSSENHTTMKSASDKSHSDKAANEKDVDDKEG